MNTRIPLKLVLFAALFLSPQRLCIFAQGTFANLDFESALVPDMPPGQGGPVSASLAFPAWMVTPGQNGDVLHNVTPLGASVLLLGPTWPTSEILEGRYTAVLYSNPLNGGSSLAQSGQVPPTAQSLMFYAEVFNMEVSFAGNPLPFCQIASGPNYGIYGVDVRTLAGASGELRFSALPMAPGVVGGVRLDNIHFSNEPIPEPTTVGLLVIGALLLGWKLHTLRPSKKTE
jgi:hypothetical protein